MLEELNCIWGPITLMIVSAISAYVFKFFNSKKNDIIGNSEDIARIQRDIKQIKRLMLIVAKITDRDMEKLHPNSQPYFEDLVTDLLSRDALGSKP